MSTIHVCNDITVASGMRALFPTASRSFRRRGQEQPWCANFRSRVVKAGAPFPFTSGDVAGFQGKEDTEKENGERRLAPSPDNNI